MRRPLRLLNLVFGLVAALIAVAVVKTWVSPAARILSSPTAMTSQDTEALALAYTPTARPPLAQFDVLLEKNPFKQPPPLASRPGPPPPPPIPPPTLVGTMLVDHERRAILSDRGKSDIYSIGQAVAGGVVSEIKEDRILLKRGNETLEIMLKAAIKSTPPAAQGASSPAPPVSVPPPVPAASPIDRQEEGRGQERLRLKEERRLQREQFRGR